MRIARLGPLRIRHALVPHADTTRRRTDDGRLRLAAFALGIGASAITFLDSEIAGLLDEPLAGLLITSVGVPAYRHRPGGPPGAPIKMQPLRPRS